MLQSILGENLFKYWSKLCSRKLVISVILLIRQILRPTCSGGNLWCPISNTCTSSCDWTAEKGDPVSFSTCAASSLYCPYGNKCVTSADPYTCPSSSARIPTQASDPQRADYTVVTVVTRTVVAGFNYLKLDDITTDMLPEVKVGDILGFKQTIAGPRVGREESVTGSVEFQYNSAVTSEGSTISGGVGAAKRHHIKAIVSQPMTSTFEHSFSAYGDFWIEARLTNPLTRTPVVARKSVGVQSPVLGKIRNILHITSSMYTFVLDDIHQVCR